MTELHHSTKSQIRDRVKISLSKSQTIFAANNMHIPEEIPARKFDNNMESDIRAYVENGVFIIQQVDQNKIIREIFRTEDESEAREVTEKIYLNAHRYVIDKRTRHGGFVPENVLEEYPEFQARKKNKKDTIDEINHELHIIQTENLKYFNPAMIPPRLWEKAMNVDYNKEIDLNYKRGLKIHRVGTWCGWASGKKAAQKKARNAKRNRSTDN